jgi:hypothetical protein
MSILEIRLWGIKSFYACVRRTYTRFDHFHLVGVEESILSGNKNAAKGIYMCT